MTEAYPIYSIEYPPTIELVRIYQGNHDISCLNYLFHLNYLDQGSYG